MYPNMEVGRMCKIVCIGIYQEFLILRMRFYLPSLELNSSLLTRVKNMNVGVI